MSKISEEIFTCLGFLSIFSITEVTLSKISLSALTINLFIFSKELTFILSPKVSFKVVSTSFEEIFFIEKVFVYKILSPFS